MNKTIQSARITLWAIRCVDGILVVLLFAMPTLLRLYAELRFLSGQAYYGVLVAFYCCAVVAGLALLRLDRLIRNILDSQVFIRENVRLIRQVRWCCGGVSLICLPVAVLQYPPLLFVVVIMGFLCLVVSVTAELMDAAVTLREENDLTV